MRLGIMAGYSGPTLTLPMDAILEADRLGYYAVWTAEAYGSDAVTPLAWIGARTERIRLGTAILQMPARTPAMTAMTAATLDQLSGGRMLLGLGLSGPQVVEGWHGVAYGKPLGRTREVVSIVRRILARREPLVHEGEHYQIPYRGADATGLGKPLKSIIHGRADIPIYLAAIGPRNVELCAEIADGWLPILFAPQRFDEVYRASLEAGFARAGGGKSLENFDIAPTVSVVIGDDVDACRAALKPFIALYVGGMGAKGKNFYHDLVSRYGYAAAADRIQELYLQGQREEAAAAVPDELVDDVALCGPKARIAERLELWKASPVTTMNLTAFDVATVRTMAELVLGDAVLSAAEQAAPVKENLVSIEIPSESQAPKSAVIFENMSRRIVRHPNIVQQVNAVFQFHITGDPGGDWVVDLKNGSGEVRDGVGEGADVTLTAADEDFYDLATGKLNAMAALATGKIKVQGNPMLATKLQSLFS